MISTRSYLFIDTAKIALKITLLLKYYFRQTKIYENKNKSLAFQCVEIHTLNQNKKVN